MLSGAVLRRNLLEHERPSKTIPPSLKRSAQKIVYTIRKPVTSKQLGFALDASLGQLSQFAEINEYSRHMRKHNDPEDHIISNSIILLHLAVKSFLNAISCASPSPPCGCSPTCFVPVFN